MPDRRTTHADTTSDEMPQAVATPRADEPQMDEPKVHETVEKRDIMEKLYLMMIQYDQSFQALNRMMELQTVRTIESLSSTTRTQWKEEDLEETSKEAVLHDYNDKVDDETSVNDTDEALEDDTGKGEDLREITEETIANKYVTDQNDEDENTSELDEAIPNDSDKDQNDENVSQCLSGDRFQDDSDSKNE